jgi:hypothetical protein
MDPVIAAIRQNERRAARRRQRAALRRRLEDMRPDVARLLGRGDTTMSTNEQDGAEAPQNPIEAPEDPTARALNAIAARLEALDRRVPPPAEPPPNEARAGARAAGVRVPHSQRELVRMALHNPSDFERLFDDPSFDPWSLRS